MERAHKNTLVTVFWKIFNNKFRPKCKISSKPEVDQKKILKFFKTLPWPWEWILREVFHAHYARTNSRSDLKSDILEKKFFRKNWKLKFKTGNPVSKSEKKFWQFARFCPAVIRHFYNVFFYALSFKNSFRVEHAWARLLSTKNRKNSRFSPFSPVCLFF